MEMVLSPKIVELRKFVHLGCISEAVFMEVTSHTKPSGIKECVKFQQV